MKIDTSTTAGKIKVMQAYEDGSAIQAHYRLHNRNGWLDFLGGDVPEWRWLDCDYRIKPQTVEDAAKDRDGVGSYRWC